MKKRAVFLVFLLVCGLFFTACTGPYREKDFLGKTSAEILEIYGDFDCVTMPIGRDGLYRNCRCGYTVKEPTVGFLGTSPEVLFFIRFDDNGIAVACEEGYRPGG